MPAQPGSHIAGYRVIRALGSGGMGDVYVVENESLKREEAMKVISVGGAGNDDFQQRFTNEARTAASLDHPSIITVHSYGVDGGQPWFTMNYLKGPDLASAQLTPAEAVTVIGQVADGLDYAHARTVVHRDIKPANIVVTRNTDGTIARAVMLDFGIAKLADSPQLTAVNSVVGTAAYTAPEIISGQPASGKSDQYSLACTAYQLFAGAAPFRADSTTALMMAHVQQPPPALGQVRPDLAALGPVLQRAMAKDPAARYPTCREFAEDLQRALAQTQAGTATSIAPQPGPGHPSSPGPGYSSSPGYLSSPGYSSAPGRPSAPGMTPPPSGPGTYPFGQQPNPAAPHYVSQPGMSHPGMTPPPFDPATGQPSYPGMPGPHGAWGGAGYPPPTAKKSNKKLWILLGAAAVLILAVAGTLFAVLPRGGDEGPPPIAHIDRQLVTSTGTTCAVRDKSLYCWGSNDAGQIGDGTTSRQNTPVKLSGLTDVTSVTIGSYRSKAKDYMVTTCAVAEGDAYCWGANTYGQLGDGSEDNHQTPTKVVGLPKVTAVVTDYGATCAITVDKDVYCWGSGENGQIGTGNTARAVTAPEKIRTLSGVTSLSGSGGSFCAIDGDAALQCWGANYTGQLGDGTTEQRNTPTKVQNLTKVTSVSVGTMRNDEERIETTTCAVSDGKIYCWGAKTPVNPTDRTSPGQVTSLSDVTMISVGVSSACAVVDSEAWCWGQNNYGQVGNGDDSGSSVSAPYKVSTLTDVSWVTTGFSTTCAGVAENDEVYCWGFSKSGQIGNSGAGSEKQLQPIKVSF